MSKELLALESNHAWDLVPLPPGKRAIGSKWFFKVKLKADGNLERYKVRLVAKATPKSLVLTIKKPSLL